MFISQKITSEISKKEKNDTNFVPKKWLLTFKINNGSTVASIDENRPART